MCIELIAQARQMGASDLHLTIGAPPVVRLLGELKPLKTAPVTAKQLQNFIALLSSEQKQQLEQQELEQVQQQEQEQVQQLQEQQV